MSFRKRRSFELLESKRLLTGSTKDIIARGPGTDPPAEGAEDTVGLTVSAIEIDEGIGELVVIVARTAGGASPATVDYEVAADSATSPDDFNAVSGTLTFAAGETQQQFSVPIVDDAIVESPEQFSIRLSNPTGEVSLGADTQIVTIRASDLPDNVLFRDDFETIDQWTVDADSFDTATSGRWEIGAPESTSLDGTVIQPAVTAGGARAMVTGLASAGEAAANDLDGVTTVASIPIEFPADSEIELSFDYFIAHGPDSSPDDALLVAIGGSSPADSVFQATAIEGTTVGAEWVSTTVDVSRFSGQTVRLHFFAVDVPDGPVEGAADSLFEVGIDNVLVEVEEPVPGAVTFAESVTIAREQVGSVTLEIERNGTDPGVMVDYAISAISATAGEDFEVNSGTVTFAEGSRRTEIQIEIIDDEVTEQLETFSVTLSNPGGGATLGDQFVNTVTIVDNDHDGVDFLPDLVPVTTGMVEGSRMDLARQFGRALLRFPTTIANAGDGPLEIWGGPSSGNSQQVFQRIYQRGGGSRDTLAGNFVFHPGHGHVHLEGFATFQLRGRNDDGTPGPVVASGGKTSFCLLNIDHSFPAATSAAARVEGRGGSSCETIQGISVGWADVYGADLEDQWIDVTDIPDGDYFLEIVTDPDNNITETDETNNGVLEPITVDNPYHVDGEFVETPELPPDDHPNFANLDPAPATMTLGEATDGNIEYSGDQDLFQFQATSGSSYEVSVELVSLSDSVLRVIDTDGTSELAFDDDGGGSLASRLVWSAPIDGTYYLDVRSFGSSGTGTYRLTVTEIEDDFGNNASSAGQATQNYQGGDIQYGGFPGDVDWFQFEATEGQFYEIDTRARGLTDTVITLYDADGITVLEANDEDSRSVSGSRLYWQAESAGTLYVQVAAGFRDGDQTGDYRIRVRAVDAPDDDFPNRTVDAAPLTLDETISGEVNYERDVDRFRMTVTAGQEYIVSLNPVGIVGSISVQNESGGVVAFPSDSAQQVAWTPDSDGEVFVLVRGVDGELGPWSLRSTIDDGENSESATLITAPGEQLAGFHEGDGSDWFAFDAGPDAVLAFSTPGVDGVVPPDTTITLYAADGTTVIEQNDDESPFVNAARLVWSPEAEGRYFVAVSSPERGAYRLLVEDLTPPESFIGLPVKPDTPDHGADEATATSIELPANVEAAINEPGDVDWFAFEAEENSTYLITTADHLSEFPQPDLAFTIFDDDGAVESSEGENELVSTPRLLWTPSAEGTYRVAVSAGEGQQGNYNLIVQDVTPTDDFDADLQSPNRFALFEVQPGRIDFAADVDTHRVTMRRNQPHEITIRTETAENVTMRVFDRDRETLVEEVTATPDAPGIVTFTPENSGSRYFEVSGGKGDYSLLVAVDDHGGNAERATDATLNSPMSGRIETGPDADWFRFNAVEGIQYRIQTSLSAGDSTLRLYSSDGAELRFNDDGAGGLASLIEWTAAESGIYFAVVESFSNSGEVTYNLVIEEQLPEVDPADAADFNGDGVVNATDIDLLFAALRVGDANPVFDLSEDGQVDDSDHNAFFELTGIFLGDADLDRDVDMTDFMAVSKSFGTENAGWEGGDFDGNGVVDVDDFLILSSNYGLDR